LPHIENPRSVSLRLQHRLRKVHRRKAKLPRLVPRKQTLATVPAKPPQYFNDFASLIDQKTAQQFNHRLEDFERQTSNQILVVIYPKLPADTAIEDLALAAFRKLKVGEKGKNNGVILFIFVQDEKIRIATGLGLEQALPNSLCKTIISDQIVPRFKARDFSGGLNAAIDSIVAATRDAYSGTVKTVAEEKAANKAGQPSATPTAAIAH
jgi:uncharacterized protein